MDTIAKEITNKIAKKIAGYIGINDQKHRINKLKYELENHYYKVYTNKIPNTITGNSYKRNLRDFSALKVDNLVKEINNIDKTSIILDVNNAMEGINSRYNDNWLRVEKDVIQSRLINDDKFNNYIKAQKDSPNVMVVYVCSEDETTCDICGELDGFSASPDDPVWNNIEAGAMHFNCRCTTELDYDGSPTELPDVEKEDNIADRNTGKIFTL